jgi:hypothetical protein
MLEHLTVEQIREIMRCHEAAERDHDAMYDYLRIGKKVSGFGRIINVGRDLPKAKEHSDELHGPEWHRLRELANALPEPALIVFGSAVATAISQRASLAPSGTAAALATWITSWASLSPDTLRAPSKNSSEVGSQQSGEKAKKIRGPNAFHPAGTL